MEGVPDEIDLGKLRRKLALCSNYIQRVEDLHVWSLTTNKNAATCHVKVKSKNIKDNYQKLLLALTIVFRKFNIYHTTIQIEFDTDNQYKLDCRQDIHTEIKFGTETNLQAKEGEMQPVKKSS